MRGRMGSSVVGKRGKRRNNGQSQQRNFLKPTLMQLLMKKIKEWVWVSSSETVKMKSWFPDVTSNGGTTSNGRMSSSRESGKAVFKVGF